MTNETPEKSKENRIGEKYNFHPENVGREGVYKDSNQSAEPEHEDSRGDDSDTNTIQSLKDKENQPRVFINNYNKPPDEDALRSSKVNGRRFGGLLSGKKGKLGLAAGLLGVSGFGIVFLIPMLLSLKMFGLLANMTDAASKIPAYAVEQRTEYLVTRAYATWLIRKAAGDRITDSDTAAVFCKNGSITCSLKWTYINDYFDKRYELSDFQPFNDGSRQGRITVTPKGMDRLGAKARSWEVRIETELNGTTISKQIDTININSEMKRAIREQVSQKMHTKSTISRYIARKALMKRYGVTHFRGFEKTANSIAEKKAAFKAALVKNTVGKISPKAADYLACLSGGASCDKFKELVKADLDDTRKPGESDDEYNKRKARNDALRKAAQTSVDSVPGDGKISKHISKQLIAKFGGGAVALAGTVDMIMKALGTLDSGALETITYDIRSDAYVNYAFGDESGLAPNIERDKAGEGNDPDIMPIVAEQLENVESSPIFQAETGLLTGSAVSGKYVRICDKEGSQSEVTLENSYTCPERQVVQNLTKFMESDHMSALAEVAGIWNSSAGKVFDWVDNIIGSIMDEIGATKLIEVVFGKVFNSFAEWVIGLFFDIPALGDEATGDQNYDAFSAGVWIAQNEMMQNGVEEGGDLLGAGGALLTNEQIAAVQKEYSSQEDEYFHSQPYLAKFFSTELSKSFVNRLLASIPVKTFTSPSGVVTLPSVAAAALPNIFSTTTNAEVGPMNPHNIPLYGYYPGHPALTADPTTDTYTEESCKASAKARSESYKIDREKFPIKVFTKEDPCALDRIAVGNILYDMGVTDDKHSFEELTGSLNCGPFGGDSGGSVGGKMSESQFQQQIATYGLPAPKAENSPDLLHNNEPVKGYNELLQQLKSNPKASWATQALLNGEKKWKSAGGSVKEYLNTTWIWFENGQSAWPDPYEMNCLGNNGVEATYFCSSTNFQVAGYQPGDTRTRFKEVYDKLYKEDQLESVMQAVVKNSSNASKDKWNYNNASNNGKAHYFKDFSGTSFTTLWPTKAFNDEEGQIKSLILGKDPNMAAALNSFAVSDNDILAHIGRGEECGQGWGSYICKPARQQMANMMMALYMFDGQGPASSSTQCLNGSTGSLGTLEMIWGDAPTPTLTQDFGPTEFSKTVDWYDYSLAYGFSEPGHTGLDYGMPDGTKLYSPVSGVVEIAGGSGYFRDDRGDGPGKGELRIKMDNGHRLILGHMQLIEVKIGDRVSPGTYVGLSGKYNGPHVHIEYRIPDSGTLSGERIVDPRDRL